MKVDANIIFNNDAMLTRCNVSQSKEQFHKRWHEHHFLWWFNANATHYMNSISCIDTAMLTRCNANELEDSHFWWQHRRQQTVKHRTGVPKDDVNTIFAMAQFNCNRQCEHHFSWWCSKAVTMWYQQEKESHFDDNFEDKSKKRGQQHQKMTQISCFTMTMQQMMLTPFSVMAQCQSKVSHAKACCLSVDWLWWRWVWRWDVQCCSVEYQTQQQQWSCFLKIILTIKKSYTQATVCH